MPSAIPQKTDQNKRSAERPGQVERCNRVEQFAGHVGQQADQTEQHDGA